MPWDLPRRVPRPPPRSAELRFADHRAILTAGETGRPANRGEERTSGRIFVVGEPAMGVKDRDTVAPFIDSELNEWEASAHSERGWSGEEVRRLIAEVRRLRYRVGPPQIVRKPGRCGGDPTVGETRICVHHVLALALQYGW